MSISDKTFQSFFDNVEKLYKTYAGPGLDGFDAEFQVMQYCNKHLVSVMLTFQNSKAKMVLCFS